MFASHIWVPGWVGRASGSWEVAFQTGWFLNAGMQNLPISGKCCIWDDSQQLLCQDCQVTSCLHYSLPTSFSEHFSGPYPFSQMASTGPHTALDSLPHQGLPVPRLPLSKGGSGSCAAGLHPELERPRDPLKDICIIRQESIPPKTMLK